jgi:hypothetical protein
MKKRTIAWIVVGVIVGAGIAVAILLWMASGVANILG